jgi:hypothetical protein
MTNQALTHQRRREAVIASALNGIDFVDVLDTDAPSSADRQRILRVHFLKSPPPPGLEPANVAIIGGDRITSINVDHVAYDGDAIVLHLDAYGDFSTYRLQLAAAAGSAFDVAQLDPVFSAVDFSFKSDCPTDFDCEDELTIPRPAPVAPHLDYLSKDYTSFRQLMLDRMAALAPQWTERNAADVGVTMVELLAHVGDVLSYRQDAVATEAYLGSARRRVSVRRHARLVNYFVHEGVNARAFLHFSVEKDTLLPKGVRAFTAVPGQAARLAPSSPDLDKALSRAPEIYETLHDAQMFRAHNQMSFHTWGDRQFQLAAGATSATLKGALTDLKPDDILVFEELLGARTGLASEADPARRHSVRLTRVAISSDPLGGAFETPSTQDSTPVTEIEWHHDDATPFAFQISAEVETDGSAHDVENISVARGNIVLADHGATRIAETLDEVPAPFLFRPPGAGELGRTPIPPRFRPRLRGRPLVHAVPYDPKAPPRSARATLSTSPQDALPVIELTATLANQAQIPWSVRRDLLQSAPEANDFVIETEADGSAWLRFGDDVYGQRPAPGAVFTARYRTGESPQGNVAPDSIVHVVSDDESVSGVRNPLPAQGGVPPESLDHVRQTAPFAFRTQRRAVTREDYQATAELHPGVQRAAASFRWTGSWPTIFLSIDRFGGLPVDQAFEEELREFVEPYRLAGHDLEIEGPQYVSLEIEMRVSVLPDYFKGDVKRALLSVFGTGNAPDGRLGVFHPDNFSFGQPVYLSALYAAAQATDGVASVEVTRFQRRGRPDPDPIRIGRLELGRQEIARLDNDPDFPERGVFSLIMGGGK